MFTFNNATFDLLVKDGTTPVWKPVVEATDRKLIGTRYVERNIRHTMYVLEAEAWIEPGVTAFAAWDSLRLAYINAITDILAGDVDGWTAILVAFDMVPRMGGADGYGGTVTFVRPQG